MTYQTRDTRPWWLPLLVAFVVGLLIGWWAIGWGLWPVTYTNALPQDLRAAERDQYLIMAAESFAANADLELARQRLATWSQDELTTDLHTLQERLASENPTRAVQVQNLMSALSLTPAQAGSPPVAEATAPSSLVQTVRTICTGMLWLLIALLGIVLVVILWRRWSTAHARASDGSALAFGEPPFVERSASDIAEQAKSVWPGTAPEVEDEVSDRSPVWRPATTETDPHRTQPETSETPAAATGRQGQPAGPREFGTEPVAPVLPLWRTSGAKGSADTAPGTPVRIAEFEAAYHMGEPGYDEAFDINDEQGGHIGQCGLSLNTPVGRGNDQAAALQVWLWDSKDPDTEAKVLMSESAYRDTALRDQLAGDYPAVPVRPRSEFELETHNLLLLGLVEQVTYAEQEPQAGVFADMVVRMRVYRKG